MRIEPRRIAPVGELEVSRVAALGSIGMSGRKKRLPRWINAVDNTHKISRTRWEIDREATSDRHGGGQQEPYV
jgi:hypothetical protein